ncbi:MAG: phosphatidate cytidylyltransferase [Bacteriovoracaceae bacterium]|nr:phosphatidate cytidylyltransferase [Bacteriovoracaceae bacterium]
MKNKPLTNSQSRIISSVVLILAIVIVFILGKLAAKLAFILIFSIVLDEILVNFKHIKRPSLDYIISFVGFFLGSIFILSDQLNAWVLYWNTLYLIIMVASLIIFSNSVFLSLRRSYFFNRFIRYTLFLLPLFPVLTFSYLIDQENWRFFLAIVLVIGASSDSLGWIVGKTWGKHKLYPKVSPNKTIEGALGAIVGPGLILASFFTFMNGQSWPILFFIFSFLAAVGVLGDLWQSRLKRLFKIKDSSQLIPGHGGVYDRVDSHIFIAPFFLQFFLFYPYLFI